MSTEVVPAPAPSLPRWPEAPEAPDPAAASFLIVAIGGSEATRETARDWVRRAEAMAPTTLVLLDDVDDPADATSLDEALSAARTGVRIMVTGGQYDVLRALTTARDAGAVPAELSAYVCDTSDLPVYCAHCRDTHRATGAPGTTITCPGCVRRLEIHAHHTAALGAFLASEA